MRVFDAHFHIIDPKHPAPGDRGYVPEPFTVEDYLGWFKNVELVGGLVVAGSFQGYDWRPVVDAVSQLGEGFYGVINPPEELSRTLVEELHGLGVRGVRFNLRRMGMELVNLLEEVALKVWDWCRWHVDVYVENRHLPRIRSLLRSLPAVVIDHLGLTLEGFDALLELVEAGVRVKVSGFGRLDFDPVWAVRRIREVSSKALLFATDLPSTRAPRPFSWDDVEMLGELADEALLFRNALEFLGGDS